MVLGTAWGMTMPKISLRARFIAAHVINVIVLSITFGLTIGWLIESYEQDVLYKQVQIGLDQFAEAWGRDRSIQPPDIAGTQVLIVTPEMLPRLRPGLQALPLGMHDDVLLDGIEYFVGRRDVDDTRLYLLLDSEYIEVMEERMQHYALMGMLVAIFIATLVAIWLSNQVLKPITALSKWVHTLDPGRPHQSFDSHFGDDALDKMALTIDAYADRIDQFIAREKSFTEDVSHELRTPIAVARSTVTLLLEDASLTGSTRQRVERMDRAVRQMQELVEAVLFLAREDGGGGNIPIYLHELLLEVVESRADAAAAARVTITTEAMIEQQVQAHPGVIISIIGNLLDNAIRHGGAGVVTVSLQQGQLFIDDEGPGIPDEKLPLLMDRGARGVGSKGNGLGLHIVRSLCERQGWTMTISTRPQGGTSIQLCFPATNLTVL